MSIQFWAWALITAVLVVVELVYRDLLTAPFAAGAAAATLLEAFGADPTWGWIALVAIASALTIWMQRVVVPRRRARAASSDS